MATYRIEDLIFKGLAPGLRIKAEISPGTLDNDTYKSEGSKQIEKNREVGANQGWERTEQSTPQGERSSRKTLGWEKIPSSIILVDIDFRGPAQDSLYGYDKLVLPTVPLELSYDPNPQWATIASIGRNAPFYNYTGSEDTLSFQIDWFSKTDAREDVLYACRWVEALSKADGYSGDPHRVMLVWGEDDKLFQNDIWVVHKASYRLSQFQKHRSMLPQQAYQEITLKKVLQDNSNRAKTFGSAYYG